MPNIVMRSARLEPSNARAHAPACGPSAPSKAGAFISHTGTHAAKRPLGSLAEWPFG
jgi:hypothetical protein